MNEQKANCPSEGVLRNQPKDFGVQVFPDHIANIGIDASGLAHTLAYLGKFLEKRGYLDYIKYPHQIYIDSARKPALANLNSEKHDLPKIFQSVWITNPASPKAIKPEQLSNFFTQAGKLEGYEKVIWTNIEPAIFRELNKDILTNQDITIKNIANLETNHTELLNFLISPEKYIPRSAIEKNLFNGVLIDLAKYLVMEVNGGVLADFNFAFSANFNKNNIESYDFIAKHKGYTFIENGFFVAKAQHIIFTEVLDIMHDLLISTSDCGVNEHRELLHNPPESFQSGDYLVNRYTMEPLFMAYLKYNNLENNVDALMGKYPTETLGQKTHELIERVTINQQKNITHEELSYKLYSDNFEDIQDYAKNYLSILRFDFIIGTIPYYSLIEENLIGEDHHSCSWVEAGVTYNIF